MVLYYNNTSIKVVRVTDWPIDYKVNLDFGTTFNHTLKLKYLNSNLWKNEQMFPLNRS